MNGYFQLHIDQVGTSVLLFPPTDGGTSIDAGELLQYLTIKQIAYDARTLGAALQNLIQPTKVLLNMEQRYPEREGFFLRVSPDKMQAVARFYPPSNTGAVMDAQEIVGDLRYQGINAGIDENAITLFCAKREYCTDIVIARGKEPVQGKDARIEYYFNTNPSVRPTLLEDGSVDFFNLNTLNRCRKGDLLAKLFPAEQGTPGYDVSADVIKPRDVKKLMLHFGRNIELSEDRTEIRSMVDGHVTFATDTVFVSDVYEVENVDNSTGNIDFEGSVKINGNVKTNFVVKASGNIEIKGVVEGATVEAGGDIIIARGMNGMSKGILKAGGNIICKFLENCSVEAKGYVETEAVLHSNVSAGTEINVNGKRAFITGGVVRATNQVSMKTLGSPMAAETRIEVGADPTIKTEYLDLQKSIVEDTKTLNQITPVLTAVNQKIQAGIKIPAEQLKQLLAMTEKADVLREAVRVNQIKMDEIEQMLESSIHASVVVRGEVFAGARIVIGDASMTVKNSLQHCRFIKEKGEVVISAI